MHACIEKYEAFIEKHKAKPSAYITQQSMGMKFFISFIKC